MAESRAAEALDLSNLSQQDIEDIEAGWTVPYEAQANRWEEPQEYESTELTQTQNDRMNRLERNFNDRLLIEFHKSLLENYGYYLLEQIYAGKEEWDHQVWKVRKFVWDEEGVVYAVKIVSLFYYRKRFVQIERTIKNMLKESNLLLELNHKNVIKVYDVIGLRDHGLPVPSYVCSVLELMGGNLEELMRDDIMNPAPRDERCEQEAKYWFRQVAHGLNYLHNEITGGQRVSHLALKPSNILHKSGTNGEMIFKITDFEECLVFQPTQPDAYPHPTFRRNKFSPPEKSKPYLRRTRPMDIYSLGMILGLGFIRHTRWLEFRDLAQADREAVKKFWDKYPQYDYISKEGLHVLQNMTYPDPDFRASIDLILDQKWLKSYKIQKTS